MQFLLKLLAIVPMFAFAHEYLLSLGELGGVRYTYDDEHLLQVDRLSPSEGVMYTHTYQYGAEGNLLSEKFIGDLGEISYEDVIRPIYDEAKAPIEYDSKGRVAAQGDKRFTYDDQHRLIEVASTNGIVTYAYGPSGERISRTANGETESYLYIGANEIAILDKNGQIKELRIPGLSFNENIVRPIAIETRDAIYAPIHDIQGNIIKLINVSTREVVNLSIPNAYGKGLSKDSPVSWIFSGKHYDPVTGLVYFGARYYSPELKQWLTPDPVHQSDNPYEYCLGDPLAYVDPDGRFAIPLVGIVWGAGAAVTAPVWAPYALAAAGGAAVGYVGYKTYELWQEKNTPPYNGKELGTDPTKCPIKGFKWRGAGKPGSKEGGWYNDETKESLRPDLSHPGDVDPHWDYKGPKGRARIYIDGDYEWK